MAALAATVLSVNQIEPWDDLWIFGAVFSLIWGLIWGSFFNVCIYRIPVKKSLIHPGSHCYHCGTFLKPYDNIPLISYLILRGNCRSCGTRFSSRYFFVELLTGLLFMILFLKFGFAWALPFHVIFMSLLLVGVFTDIDHFILPDGITLGGLCFAVATAGILGNKSLVAEEYAQVRDIYSAFSYDLTPADPNQLNRYQVVAWSMVSAAFGYGLLWAIGFMGRILFRKEAMGMGDVKLFAFLGAYMGAVNCIIILFLSALIGSVCGLTLLLWHKFFGEDEFEDIALYPSQTVNSQWLPAVSQSRSASTALIETQHALSPGQMHTTETQAETHPEGLSLRIARRTSRQLHHFPYGPYIAVAAALVLIFIDQIRAATRDFLLLP